MDLLLNKCLNFMRDANLYIILALSALIANKSYVLYIYYFNCFGAEMPPKKCNWVEVESRAQHILCEKERTRGEREMCFKRISESFLFSL